MHFALGETRTQNLSWNHFGWNTQYTYIYIIKTPKSRNNTYCMHYTLSSIPFHFAYEQIEPCGSHLMDWYKIRTGTDLFRALRTPWKHTCQQLLSTLIIQRMGREGFKSLNYLVIWLTLLKLKMPEC